MNLRVLRPFLIFFFITFSAFIAADMLNTVGKGALHTLPTFNPPVRIRRETVPAAITGTENHAETVEAATSDAPPPIRLLGTITGNYPYAVILDPANNRQELYRLKEDAGGGWIVNEIEKNRVTLKKGDKKEVLEVKFIESEPKTASGAGLKPAPAATGIRLNPADVEGALSDLNKVMTQARVVPNLVEGKTSGYRVFNIVPESIYTKLGLRNNDVVERVNGVEINSPDALYQLFQQIKNEKRISLDFSRSGKKESVNIDIR